LIYQDISIDQLYSPEAESAYWLLNGFTLHLIVLLKTASTESIYQFLMSERFRRLPAEDRKTRGPLALRLRNYLSKYMRQR
jgi:hypothetical protein